MSGEPVSGRVLGGDGAGRAELLATLTAVVVGTPGVVRVVVPGRGLRRRGDGAVRAAALLPDGVPAEAVSGVRMTEQDGGPVDVRVEIVVGLGRPVAEVAGELRTRVCRAIEQAGRRAGAVTVVVSAVE